MRIIATIIVILLGLTAIAQTTDTVIDKGVYQSHFCYKLKEPIFVTYKLWKSGGDCDRTPFRFHNDTKIKTATASDYSHSGYDIGHMASAEDFADSCLYDERTFRFYNALPQTPNLNRGIWKHWETEIRKESQTDSILVICGGLFGDCKDVIGKGVVVPTMCWKVTQSLSSLQVTHVLLFTNNADATCKEITINDLESLTGYKLPLITKPMKED